MKVKNLWAIIMTVALAVGSLGGCGNSATSSMESSSQDGTDNVVSAESVSDEEKITLTYWIPMNSSLAQVEQSYDNTLYYQELQERLNILDRHGRKQRAWILNFSIRQWDRNLNNSN